MGEWIESRSLFERPLIPILSGGNFNEDGSIPSRAILEWTPIDHATSYQVSLICSSAEGVVNLNYRAFTLGITIDDPSGSATSPRYAQAHGALRREGHQRSRSISARPVRALRVSAHPDVHRPMSAS